MQRFLVIAFLVVVGAVLFASYQQQPFRDFLACAKADNPDLCYSNGVEQFIGEKGLGVAFDALAAAYEADARFAGTCHAFTHEIGKAAYREFHARGEVELSLKQSYCGYGFYHGFLEELLAQTSDLEEARRFCAYAGEEVPNPPGQAEGSCYHGIGHGVTDGYDPTTWGDPLAQVTPGLAMCKHVAPNDTARARCASGVFNALANMYFSPRTRDYFDAGANPYTLCKTADFDPIDRSECYSQMNTLAAYMAKDELPAIVAFADVIPENTYREVALKEAASYYVQQLKRTARSLTLADAQTCMTLDPKSAEACVRGIVGGVVEFGAPGKQHEEALKFCNLAASGDFQRQCFAFALEISRWYFSDEMPSICARVPRQYRTEVCTT